MRLAALYTVFNGLELLDKSIENILPCVDEIIICYQNISNTGNHSSEVYPAVKKYIARDKFSVIEFSPAPGINTKDNERAKHNQLLEYAKQLRCTHYVFMATDHFYFPDEFLRVKNNVADFDCSFSKMFTYYKYPKWQLIPTEDYYMPFICRLHTSTEIVKGKWSQYPAKVDPALMVNTTGTFILLEPGEIMLHHYSMIRNNIVDKFKNAASSMRWSQQQINQYIDEYSNYSLEINSGISYFSGRKIKVVPDYFELT